MTPEEEAATRPHGRAIAVLADDLLRQQRVRALLTDAGYDVVVSTSPANLNPALLKSASIQLWLVEADLDGCSEAVRDALLETTGARVLFNEAPVSDRQDPDHRLWERRLLVTVRRYLDQSSQHQATQPVNEPAELPTLSAPTSQPMTLPTSLSHGSPKRPQLWILAASLGGPVAVKQFLDSLPAGLPCRFLYAQHIGPEFQVQLKQSTGRHTELPLKPMTKGAALEPGSVHMVPVERSVRLIHGDRIEVNPYGWRGPYSPSLDELMQNMVADFDGDCHTIVFSGMTGDALLGSSFIQANGGEVWIQSTHSCIQPAMPNAIREAGLHTGQGDPVALAQGLVHHLQTLTESTMA